MFLAEVLSGKVRLQFSEGHNSISFITDQYKFPHSIKNVLKIIWVALFFVERPAVMGNFAEDVNPIRIEGGSN